MLSGCKGTQILPNDKKKRLVSIEASRFNYQLSIVNYPLSTHFASGSMMTSTWLPLLSNWFRKSRTLLTVSDSTVFL